MTLPDVSISIALTSILQPEWNSRLDDDKDKFEELCQSMRVRGQLQPIQVEEAPDDKYVLIFGSRRFRAADVLGWTNIKAIVRPATTTVDRMLDNITENMQRKDLSTFEVARACASLRAAGMSLKDAAAKLGCSVADISNKALTFSELPNDIKDRWREGHKVATVVFLRQLAATKGRTEDERFKKIRERWDDRCELQREADQVLDPPKSTANGIKKGEKDKIDPPFRVSYQHYYETVRKIQKSKVAAGKLAVEAIRYLVGEVDHIKGVIDKEELQKNAVKDE